MKITAKKLAEVIPCDKVSRLSTGEFKFYRGFFYKMGGSSEAFRERIERAVATAFPTPFTVTGDGEHYTSFRAGAPIQSQSHWWVTVRFTPEVELGR